MRDALLQPGCAVWILSHRAAAHWIFLPGWFTDHAALWQRRCYCPVDFGLCWWVYDDVFLSKSVSEVYFVLQYGCRVARPMNCGFYFGHYIFYKRFINLDANNNSWAAEIKTKAAWAQTKASHPSKGWLISVTRFWVKVGISWECVSESPHGDTKNVCALVFLLIGVKPLKAGEHGDKWRDNLRPLSSGLRLSNIPTLRSF